MWTAGLIFAVSTFFTCAVAVHVRSCGNPAHSILDINWANVDPERVQLPGEITLSLSGTLKQPLTGDLEAEMTISRAFGPMWIDLPCVNTPRGRLGSCTYTNLCSTVMNNRTRTTCPGLLRDNNIPCTCTVPAGTYSIPQTVIPLDLSSVNIPSMAIAGHYQASLRVTDRSTMTEVICIDVDVEIAEPPRSTPFHSLGRFLVNLFG